MKNPLTSLDEIVWKQFEKVTQYAHRNYGWDKYDLATRCSSLVTCSLLGGGMYMAIANYSTGNFVRGSLSLVSFAAMGVSIDILSKYLHNQWRKNETEELTNTGATREPTFTSVRPAMLSIPPVLYGLGISMAAGNNFLGDEQFYNEQYRAAATLGCLMAGTMGVGFVATWYFDDQMMTPPSLKKSLWKALWSYVTRPFSTAAQKPVEQPISDYITANIVAKH